MWYQNDAFEISGETVPKKNERKNNNKWKDAVYK